MSDLPQATKSEQVSRQLEFGKGDSFSPITHLKPFDTVEIVDDKGRLLKARVGNESEQDFTSGTGIRKKLNTRLILEVLEFEGAEEFEQLNPSIYLQGVDEQEIVEMREPDGRNPAKEKGLRVALNPWHQFPIAPTKIKVTPA